MQLPDIFDIINCRCTLPLVSIPKVKAAQAGSSDVWPAPVVFAYAEPPRQPVAIADPSHGAQSLHSGGAKAEPVTIEQPERQRQTVPEWLTAIYAKLDGWRLALLEPRKLVPPGGYHSPKCVAAGLDCILRINQQKADSERLPTEVTAQAIVYRIINYRVPVYYVAEDFIRAVAATELPHDFTLADLHWPMPAMAVGFPLRFLREYLGRETCYVFATEFEAGEHRCPFLPGTPIITMPKAKVAFYSYACLDGRLESFVSSYWKEDRVDEIVQKYSYTDYTGADAPKIQEDKECCERLSVLMFKLLVVLNTRPNLVEPGNCVRSARTRKGKPRSELWSPNIIGAKYRVLRERTAPTGTHASPRLHWRRGHLRNQAHGPGRTLRKLAWIEPTLVGMQETTPAQSKGRL